MYKSFRSKRDQGQCITEVVAGILFLIVPVSLFLLDVGVLVLAQSANDTLAKNAARAAAEQVDQTKAGEAVTNVIDSFPISGFVPQKPTADVTFAAGTVTVKTTILVKLPVPVPFMPSLQEQSFDAQAREPIVSELAS